VDRGAQVELKWERVYAPGQRRLNGGGIDESVHVPGGGIDAMVLGRLVGCLGECAAACCNAPDAAAVAGALLVRRCRCTLSNPR